MKMEVYFTNQYMHGIKTKVWELKRVPAKITFSGKEKDLKAEDIALLQSSYPRNHLLLLCEATSDHLHLLGYHSHSEVLLEFLDSEAAKLIDYHGRHLEGRNVYLLLQGPQVVGIGIGTLPCQNKNIDQVIEEDQDAFEEALVNGSFVEKLVPFMGSSEAYEARSSSNSQGNFWNIFRKARKMRKEI